MWKWLQIFTRNPIAVIRGEYTEGEVVELLGEIEDIKTGRTQKPEPDEYTVTRMVPGISRGPVGQFPPSKIVEVRDKRGGLWQFRTDSVKLKEEQHG